MISTIIFLSILKESTSSSDEDLKTDRIPLVGNIVDNEQMPNHPDNTLTTETVKLIHDLRAALSLRSPTNNRILRARKPSLPDEIMDNVAPLISDRFPWIIDRPPIVQIEILRAELLNIYDGQMVVGSVQRKVQHHRTSFPSVAVITDPWEPHTTIAHGQVTTHQPIITNKHQLNDNDRPQTSTHSEAMERRSWMPPLEGRIIRGYVPRYDAEIIAKALDDVIFINEQLIKSRNLYKQVATGMCISEELVEIDRLSDREFGSCVACRRNGGAGPTNVRSTHPRNGVRCACNPRQASTGGTVTAHGLLVEARNQYEMIRRYVRFH